MGVLSVWGQSFYSLADAAHANTFIKSWYSGLWQSRVQWPFWAGHCESGVENYSIAGVLDLRVPMPPPLEGGGGHSKVLLRFSLEPHITRVLRQESKPVLE